MNYHFPGIPSGLPTSVSLADSAMALPVPCSPAEDMATKISMLLIKRLEPLIERSGKSYELNPNGIPLNFVKIVKIELNDSFVQSCLAQHSLSPYRPIVLVHDKMIGPNKVSQELAESDSVLSIVNENLKIRFGDLVDIEHLVCFLYTPENRGHKFFVDIDCQFSYLPQRL